jgi:hypothetical protein
MELHRIEVKDGFIPIEVVPLLAPNKMDVVESPTVDIFFQVEYRTVGNESGLNMVSITDITNRRF